MAVDCAIQWIRIKWSFKETLNDEVHKVELSVQFLTIDAVVLRLDHREKQAVRLGGRHNMPPPLLTLTFDLLTLKSVWESHVTCCTPVQSFVFLGILVFELEPMYATSDRRTTDADDRLMPRPLRGGGIIITER